MIRLLALCLAYSLVALPAAGEVREATGDGFTVGIVQELDATVDRAYEALTAEIGLWWDPDHTWSGDAGNLHLEARAGGILGEKLASGGSVQHMAVLYVDPGRLLRLGGGLGPLQTMPVQGVMTFELAPRDDGGATLTLTYVVAGPSAGGLAGPVDGVLAGQLQRLANHLAP